MSSWRVGKAIVLTCFFTAGYGRHRKLGVGFHTASYGRHRSQLVKHNNFLPGCINLKICYYCICPKKCGIDLKSHHSQTLRAISNSFLIVD